MMRSSTFLSLALLVILRLNYHSALLWLLCFLWLLSDFLKVLYNTRTTGCYFCLDLFILFADWRAQADPMIQAVATAAFLPAPLRALTLPILVFTVRLSSSSPLITHLRQVWGLQCPPSAAARARRPLSLLHPTVGAET